MSPSTNPEDFFPGLRIPLLKEHAKRWLKKYSETPIKRILLYKFSSPCRGEIADDVGEEFIHFQHVYAIVFEVNTVNKLLEMSTADLMAYDRRVMAAKHPESFDPKEKKDRERMKRMKKIRSEHNDIEWTVRLFRTNRPNDKKMIQMSAPYPESYSRLLAATETNLRAPYEQKYQHFLDEDFREVYNHPVIDMDSCRKDWAFRVKFRNTDLDENIRADWPHIILTPASPLNVNVRDISYLEPDMDEGDRLDENLGTGFSHSPDYRSVTKNGKNYSLSTNQAAIVECLHETFKNGNPEVSQDYIFERIGSSANNPRMRDTFKSNLEAKEDLIATGETKGAFRLKI